ncbi:hypothetical protein U9M48_004513, partial [Paspalum notatum var. saurae]
LHSSQAEAAASCNGATIAAGAGEVRRPRATRRGSRLSLVSLPLLPTDPHVVFDSFLVPQRQSADTRRLLDGMPPGAQAMRAVPPVGGSGGSIDSLPYGVLEHILGFLPSPEAVRTSLLARRWRHLWKSATGVRIGRRDGEELMSVEEARSLVNHLMLLRGDAPLDTCELTFDDFGEQDDVAHVNLWFRRAVMCKARVLKLLVLGDDCAEDPDYWLELYNLPLVSEHLTRRSLDGVRVHSKLLDFSRCLTLQHLEIDCCNLSTVTEISSDSLKHLLINDVVLCCDSCTRIYAPNLVSLYLNDLRKRTPVLYSMPSLAEAFVRIDTLCTDCCSGANYETCYCESCDVSDNIDDWNCRLLGGLSDAQHLALISKPKMVYPHFHTLPLMYYESFSSCFIIHIVFGILHYLYHFYFQKGFEICPMFQKLKILLLNDYWCVPDDFGALGCMLEHSPVLEELTLLLGSEGMEHEVEMNLRVSSTKRSAAISEHLKKVELKCNVVDDRVLKILKFLCTFNISFSFE